MVLPRPAPPPARLALALASRWPPLSALLSVLVALLARLARLARCRAADLDAACLSAAVGGLQCSVNAAEIITNSHYAAAAAAAASAAASEEQGGDAAESEVTTPTSGECRAGHGERTRTPPALLLHSEERMPVDGGIAIG